jgi:hypothetical protein
MHQKVELSVAQATRIFCWSVAQATEEQEVEHDALATDCNVNVLFLEF